MLWIVSVKHYFKWVKILIGLHSKQYNVNKLATYRICSVAVDHLFYTVELVIFKCLHFREFLILGEFLFHFSLVALS